MFVDGLYSDKLSVGPGGVLLSVCYSIDGRMVWLMLHSVLLQRFSSYECRNPKMRVGTFSGVTATLSALMK